MARAQGETDAAEDASIERRLIGEGWDAAEKLAKHTGLWLKLEAGDTATVNVFGEPKVHEKEFEDADGEVTVTTRFSVDVFIPEVGIRIWEMSAQVFTDLKRRRSKRKDFSNCFFQVERIGSGLKTKYSLDFDRVLTSAEEAARETAIAEAATRAELAAAEGN